MKKILVAFALAAFASAAFANIAGNPHDMTRAAVGGTTKGSCQYCHAPHLWTASNIPVGAGNAPLWNRDDSTAGYTSYGTTVLGTIVGAPGARSRTCLSCHDGRINVGIVNNGPDETLTVLAAAANVTSVLTNDHPVGVAIPANTTYQSPPTTSAVILAGTQVECASCHEPHTGTAGQAFLRGTAASLCGACHLK